jgi:hypothetical protein
LMLLSAKFAENPNTRFQKRMAAKSLPFWIMTWFLVELVVLTAIGTFFRGPGWSWIWPWQS